MVAVHFKTDTWRAAPRFRIPREQAREWYAAGIVTFGNRGRDVQLTFLFDGGARSASLAPGPRVAIANADGDRWAREIVEAWKAGQTEHV